MKIEFGLATISVVLFALSAVAAQTININCDFAFRDGFYDCGLTGLTVVDNENQNFVFGGQHITGGNNGNVNRLTISNSLVPFIMPQIFTTFPNLFIVQILNGGLRRFQRGAFNNARALVVLRVIDNQINSIDANAFEGASSLLTLEVGASQVQTVNELAFAGIPSLNSLQLSGNNIQQLPVRVFSNMPNLSLLSLSRNRIASLDETLLSNNSLLMFVDLQNNEINSIGRNFLNNLQQINVFDMIGNRCANAQWIVNGVTVTLETIREGLRVCFDNAGGIIPPPPPGPQNRRFIVDFQGPFILRHENGTEIVRG